MPKITYTIKLKNTQCVSPNQGSVEKLHFGSRPKEVYGEMVIDHSNNAHLFTNGTVEQTGLVEEDGAVIISNKGMIRDGRRIYPNISGMTSLASSMVDGNIAAELLSSNETQVGYIFRRSNKTVSVFREYTRANPEEARFTIRDGKAVFSHQSPVSYSELKGSNRSFTEQDYRDVRQLDLNAAAARLQMDTDAFLSHCQFVPVSEFVQSLMINTEFFPIFSSVAVYGVYQTASDTIYASSRLDVNPYNGKISLARDAFTIDGLVGVYIFYGILPGLYLRQPIASTDIASIVSEDSKLSFVAVDVHSGLDAASVSASDINLRRSLLSQESGSASVTIRIPKRYKYLTLESDSHVLAGQSIIEPGKRKIFRNKINNHLTFTLPHHLWHMASPVSVADVNSKISVSQNVGNFAAIYGLFVNGGVQRLSLMSVMLTPSAAGPQNNAPELFSGVNITGIPENYYSSRRTRVLTAGSTTPQAPSNINTISITITPGVDGLQHVLPTWAEKGSILITESGAPFYDWEYIEPDIVIFDKDKTKKDVAYTITYQSIVDPICPNLDLVNGLLDTGLFSFPPTEYDSFEGFYLLSSKAFQIHPGMIDVTGRHTYLSEPIDVIANIDEGVIFQLISSFKAFIF